MRWALGFLVGVALIGSCAPARRLAQPDDRFGHRYVGRAPDGRLTLNLTPPAAYQQDLRYPVPVDTVHVRMAPLEATGEQTVKLELLIKGSLPDACSALDAVTQEQNGHLLRVQLWMRRPAKQRCRPVAQPFRFYLLLEGAFNPGSYTLRLNDRVFPFEIRLPNAPP
jgi:hypothetical protein